MRNWLRQKGRVTAATARRITGVSLPIGGLQWADPGPADAEIVRGLLVFLEDRRVLYNPHQLEVESQVERSIHEIREECTRTLQALAANAPSCLPIQAICVACRRFHDEQQEEFPHFDRSGQLRRGAPGFFVALGAFRATVGYQVAILAAAHNLDVEGDLASIMPQLEDER